MRQFVMSLSDANEDLRLCPGGTENSPLPEDELCELVEWASPNVWQCQVLIQGFDTTENSLTDLVESLERLETAEDIFEDNHKRKGQKANASQKRSADSETQWSAKSKNGRQSNSNQKRTRNQDRWCPLHETNSHDGSECKVIKAQIERMKAAWESRGTHSDDKHQKRKGSHCQHGCKDEDINAIAERAAIRALEKKAAKKAKKSKNSEHQDSDSDEFCDAMSNLSVSSSSSSSDSE